MRIFLDTANIDEIRRAAAWGVLDGVTTNPSLVAKEGCDLKTRVLDICNTVDGPVNAEVLTTDYEGMVADARELASWHPNIVVKIPMTKNGIRAVKTVSAEGIIVNATLVFSPNQALIAAKAGAKYLSSFVGRLDDVGHEGMEVVRDVVGMVESYGFDSEVIVASVRHPVHVLQAMRVGAHVVTVPFKIMDQMFGHPLTDIGLKRFMDDWEKVREQCGGIR